MPAFSSQGCTFTFNSLAWEVTAISVEGPTPEIVNMTSSTDPAPTMRMVPTGDATSPGRITIDALGETNPNDLVGVRAAAVFTTPRGSISRTCICDSASVEATAGSLFRVRFTLMPTDYTN